MKRIAAEFGVRPWWVESVAIEYLECRDYATSNGLWEFKFDRLDDSTLRTAVQQHPLVVRELLLHNIHSQNEAGFLVRTLAGTPTTPLSLEPADLVPEGKVSTFWFPSSMRNPIETEDPKLSFGLYCQAFDEHRVWQWRVADFDGKGWTSTDVDLSDINKVRPMFEELRTRHAKLKGTIPIAFRQEAEAFYAWVSAVRKPVLDKLWELHKQKRAAQADYPKAIDRIPPLLSHAESFTIRDGEYHTRLLAERLYYRSCLNHIRRAQDAVPTSSDWAAGRLDLVYQERAEAVIMAAACLEALTNRLGAQRHERLWESVERKLSVPEKWHLLLTLAGKGKEYDESRDPTQTLSDIRTARNYLVHYKTGLEEVKRDDRTGFARTEMQCKLSDGLVNSLAGRLKVAIRSLCAALGEPMPDWLDPVSGWIGKAECPLSNAPSMPNPPREPRDYVTKAKVTLGPTQRKPPANSSSTAGESA
jgi:hypothetical protein